MTYYTFLRAHAFRKLLGHRFQGFWIQRVFRLLSRQYTTRNVDFAFARKGSFHLIGEQSVDSALNRAAILVGIVAIVGAVLLLLLEKSTPENERVLVGPFLYTQSHEWVRIQINLCC